MHLHFVHVEPFKNERIRSVQLQMLQHRISANFGVVSYDHYYHNFVVLLEHSDPDLLVDGTKEFDLGIVEHLFGTPLQLHLHFVHVEASKNERI